MIGVNALYKRYPNIPQWEINAIIVEVCHCNIKDAQLIMNLRISTKYYKAPETITPLNLKVTCSTTSEEISPKSFKHSISAYKPSSDNVIILDNISKNILAGFFGDKFSKRKEAQHNLCTVDSTNALFANNINTSSSSKLRILSNILITSPRLPPYLQSFCNKTTISKGSPDSTTPNISTSKYLETNHLLNNNQNLNIPLDNTTKHKMCFDLRLSQTRVNNLIFENEPSYSENKVLETKTPETSYVIETTKKQSSATSSTIVTSVTNKQKIFNDDFSLKINPNVFTDSLTNKKENLQTICTVKNQHVAKKDEQTNEEKLEKITTPNNKSFNSQKIANMRLFRKYKRKTNMKQVLCSKNRLTYKKRLIRSLTLERRKAKHAPITKFKQALKIRKGILDKIDIAPCACLAKFIKYIKIIRKFRNNIDALQLLLPRIYPLIACLTNKSLHNSKLSNEQFTSIFQFLDEITVKNILNKQHLLHRNILRVDNPCIYTTMSKFSDGNHDRQLGNPTIYSTDTVTKSIVLASTSGNSSFSNTNLIQEYQNSQLPTDSLYVNPVKVPAVSNNNNGNMLTPTNSMTSPFRPQSLPPFNTLKKLGTSTTISKRNNDLKITNQIMIPADPLTNFSYFQPSTTQENTINLPSATVISNRSEANKSSLVRGTENSGVETETEQYNCNKLLQNLFLNNPRSWAQEGNKNSPLIKAKPKLKTDNSKLQKGTQHKKYPSVNVQNNVPTYVAAINNNSENLKPLNKAISDMPQNNLESQTNQPTITALSVKNVPNFEELKKQNNVGLPPTASTNKNSLIHEHTESSKNKYLSQAAPQNSSHTNVLASAAPSAYISNLQALAGQQVIQNLSALQVFAAPEPPSNTNQQSKNLLIDQFQNRATVMLPHLVGQQGTNIICPLKTFNTYPQEPNILLHNCPECIKTFKGLSMLRTVPDEFENRFQNRFSQEIALRHVSGIPPDELMARNSILPIQTPCNNANIRNFNSAILNPYEAETGQVPAPYIIRPTAEIINGMPNNVLLPNIGLPIPAANFSNNSNIAANYGYSLLSQASTSTMICNKSNESCKVSNEQFGNPNHNNQRLPPISQVREKIPLPTKTNSVSLSVYDNNTNLPSDLLDSKSKMTKCNTYNNETNSLPFDIYSNQNVSALSTTNLIPPNPNPKAISNQMHDINYAESELQSNPMSNLNRYAASVPSQPVREPNPNDSLKKCNTYNNETNSLPNQIFSNQNVSALGIAGSIPPNPNPQAISNQMHKINYAEHELQSKPKGNLKRYLTNVLSQPVREPHPKDNNKKYKICKNETNGLENKMFSNQNISALGIADLIQPNPNPKTISDQTYYINYAENGLQRKPNGNLNRCATNVQTVIGIAGLISPNPNPKTISDQTYYINYAENGLQRKPNGNLNRYATNVPSQSVREPNPNNNNNKCNTYNNKTNSLPNQIFNNQNVSALGIAGLIPPNANPKTVSNQMHNINYAEHELQSKPKGNSNRCATNVPSQPVKKTYLNDDNNKKCNTYNNKTNILPKKKFSNQNVPALGIANSIPPNASPKTVSNQMHNNNYAENELQSKPNGNSNRFGTNVPLQPVREPNRNGNDEQTSSLPNKIVPNQNVSALGIADLIQLNSNPKTISDQMHSINYAENELQSKPKGNSSRCATNVPLQPVRAPNPNGIDKQTNSLPNKIVTNQNISALGIADLIQPNPNPKTISNQMHNINYAENGLQSKPKGNSNRCAMNVSSQSVKKTNPNDDIINKCNTYNNETNSLPNKKFSSQNTSAMGVVDCLPPNTNPKNISNQMHNINYAENGLQSKPKGNSNRYARNVPLQTVREPNQNGVDKKCNTYNKETNSLPNKIFSSQNVSALGIANLIQPTQDPKTISNQINHINYAENELQSKPKGNSNKYATNVPLLSVRKSNSNGIDIKCNTYGNETNSLPNEIVTNQNVSALGIADVLPPNTKTISNQMPNINYAEDELQSKPKCYSNRYETNFPSQPARELNPNDNDKKCNTYNNEMNNLPNKMFTNQNISALDKADLIPRNPNPKAISNQMPEIKYADNGLQSKPKVNSNKCATNVPSQPVREPNPNDDISTNLSSKNNLKQIMRNAQQDFEKIIVDEIKEGNIDTWSQMIQKGYSNALEVINKTTNNAQLESGYTQEVPIATNLNLPNTNIAGPSTYYTNVDHPTEPFLHDQIEEMCYNQDNDIIDAYMNQHNDLNILNDHQEIPESDSLLNLLPEDFPSDELLNDSVTVSNFSKREFEQTRIGGKHWSGVLYELEQVALQSFNTSDSEGKDHQSKGIKIRIAKENNSFISKLL